MSNNGGNLTVQYNLRWSEELRDKIAEQAKKNTRSMNQEIVARLEDSFNRNENTRSLIQDAVVLAIKAIQEDPNLLNNPKITVDLQDSSYDEKDSISIVKKYRQSSSES